MLRPGLLAAFILCVGLSMAELTITVLTVPAGMETVILRLYNLLHYGDQRGVMMLALAQGLSVAALAAAGLGVLWSLAGASRATTGALDTGRRLAGA
jgi:ABC-type spermidine/putrescine transport system permease subunit II